jgi:hypothetical protein
MMGISAPGVSNVGSVTEMGQWSPPVLNASSKAQNRSKLNPQAKAGLPNNIYTARAVNMHKVAKLYAINSFLFFLAMMITWVRLHLSGYFANN